MGGSQLGLESLIFQYSTPSNSIDSNHDPDPSHSTLVGTLLLAVYLIRMETVSSMEGAVSCCLVPPPHSFLNDFKYPPDAWI